MNKQAMKDIIVFWLGLIGCILVIGYCMVTQVAADIDKVKNELTVIDELKNQVNQLKEEIKHISEQKQQRPIEEFEGKAEPEEISRGYNSPNPVKMRVTAYDLSFASCRKSPEHPGYGITASGTRVKEWHTVAAGPDLPVGTRIYIPYFEDKPNKGIFTVEDRGSAIKEGCIDIFMSDYDDCMEFGVRELDVYVLN